MAVKYKDYKPGTYTESNKLKDLEAQADYWNGQKLQNFKYDDFEESQRTKDFLNQYNNLKRPDNFNFSKQQEWDDIINKINNREPFTYDVNGDALYQQYKDQYITGGKMAMMDTMGQAAAMTGGYDNSYAQSVGQQAYQGYLQQLNDKVPELYNLALSKYQMEGDDLYKRNDLYAGLYNRDYGQYRDAVADYNADRSHLADMWAQSGTMDWNKYTANRDTASMVNESLNDNIIANRNNWNSLVGDRRDDEWNQYLGNEELRQLAISTTNDNLYKSQGNSTAAGVSAEVYKSMPTAELVGNLQGYKDTGDNLGLATFLDDCVACGRLTESQADEYYRKYMTEEDVKKVDTTVSPKASGGGGGNYMTTR